MRETVLNLKRAVEDATLALNDARRIAADLATEPDTGEPNRWQEMNDVSAKLDAIAVDFNGLLDPLASAIKAEGEWEDEQEARADAASY